MQPTFEKQIEAIFLHLDSAEIDTYFEKMGNLLENYFPSDKSKTTTLNQLRKEFINGQKDADFIARLRSFTESLKKYESATEIVEKSPTYEPQNKSKKNTEQLVTNYSDLTPAEQEKYDDPDFFKKSSEKDQELFGKRCRIANEIREIARSFEIYFAHDNSAYLNEDDEILSQGRKDEQIISRVILNITEELGVKGYKITISHFKKNLKYEGHIMPIKDNDNYTNIYMETNKDRALSLKICINRDSGFMYAIASYIITSKAIWSHPCILIAINQQTEALKPQKLIDINSLKDPIVFFLQKYPPTKLPATLNSSSLEEFLMHKYQIEFENFQMSKDPTNEKHYAFYYYYERDNDSNEFGSNFLVGALTLKGGNKMRLTFYPKDHHLITINYDGEYSQNGNILKLHYRRIKEKINDQFPIHSWMASFFVESPSSYIILGTYQGTNTANKPVAGQACMERMENRVKAEEIAKNRQIPIGIANILEKRRFAGKNESYSKHKISGTRKVKTLENYVSKNFKGALLRLNSSKLLYSDFSISGNLIIRGSNYNLDYEGHLTAMNDYFLKVHISSSERNYDLYFDLNFVKENYQQIKSYHFINSHDLLVGNCFGVGTHHIYGGFVVWVKEDLLTNDTNNTILGKIYYEVSNLYLEKNRNQHNFAIPHYKDYYKNLFDSACLGFIQEDMPNQEVIDKLNDCQKHRFSVAETLNQRFEKSKSDNIKNHYKKLLELWRLHNSTS